MFISLSLWAVFILLPGTAIAGDECGDGHKSCAGWAKRGECRKNPKYMLMKCKKSCGLCKSECKDESKSCTRWAIHGECYKNPFYMLFKCQKACKICGEPNPKCPDKHAKCPEWARKGQCLKNPKYMLLKCQDSCHLCRPECKDDNTMCTRWAINGECYKNPYYMMYKCQKACKICGEPKLNCPDQNDKCPEWARRGECLKNPKYMLLKCRDSCHSCYPECKEESKSCVRWAIHGECYKNPYYMMYKCQKACKVCGKPNCPDSNTRCQEWVRSGECKKNPKYMLWKCKDSCHICKQECIDGHKSCPQWANRGECDKNPLYMLYNCQKSCGICVVPTTTAAATTSVTTTAAAKTTTVTTAAAATPTPTVEPEPESTRETSEETGECVDDHNKCDFWANIGECVKNPDWMLINCKKSCNVCKSGDKAAEITGECKNDAPQCVYWAKIGECEENPGYMKSKCRQSCKVCTGGKPIVEKCEDYHKNCAYWASIGECAKNPKYMLASCGISCKLCNKTVDKDEITNDCTDSFKADFVFLVDASGSVKAKNFVIMKDFIQDVVSQFPIGPNNVQVSLVRFSSKKKTKKIFYLNKYKTLEDVKTHIAAMKYVKGPTYTAYALSYIRRKVLRRSKGARKNVPKLVVILTDGASTDRKRLPKALRRIRLKGARLFVVGIGKKLNETELEYMASKPKGEHLLRAADFSKLHGIIGKLKESTCRTRPMCEEGYELKVDRCVKCSTFQIADIVFVIDASLSVGAANFEKIKQFCDSVVKKLRIGEHEVRVAAVRYSNKATTKVFLFLNSQFSKDGVLAGIDSIDYVGGMTYSGYALKMVKNQVFKVNKGMREWAKNLVVLITDGYASDSVKEISAVLQGEGAKVMAVAIGTGADVNGLQTIVSAPGDENVFAVSGYDKLHSVVRDLEEKDCTEARACPNGWLFKGDLCYECKTNFRADIVFVLDASSSVKGENFKKMLLFVQKVVSDMPIGPTKVRVSLVRYSNKNEVEVVFYLNEHFSAAELKTAVDSVKYTGGGTYTAKALDLVRTDVLTSKKGSRRWVKQLVMVITDGKASDKLSLPKSILDLQDTGARMIAVGVGSEMDEKSLKSMASPPKEQNKMHVSNFDQLATIVDKVKVTVCQ
ncbi:von Willebrand factor A domain-containing protein 2-like [Tubulanus polymorphus]|uniref:von Willebrand factor A domain-containing protein 2-like n=1 Tax=Tubulanus polymorphus TaxID=672921 RepID=UPI003DA24111